ncbi:hypothetical protein [Geminicoccus roseus]|uniref:hypothetical protein n=1 Tax=Geminicoccus roseus TaxID=404900 RepID=UPI0004194AA1|nr:hypothetical protein [Geminicoccus roseus]
MSGGSVWGRRLLVALAVVVGAGQAGSALAACAQADVAGTWQAYSLISPLASSPLAPAKSLPYWYRCTFSIKPNGQINNQNSICTDQAGANTRASGTIGMIGTGCILHGYYQVGNVRIAVSRGAMNRAKDHIDGVGSAPTGIVIFNATKL